MAAIDAQISAAARKLLNVLDEMNPETGPLYDTFCPACAGSGDYRLCPRHELDALLILKAKGG